MNYLKLFILLYTCLQLSYCNSKNGTSQKEEEISTTDTIQKPLVEVADNGSLRKEVFLKTIASLKSGEWVDSGIVRNILPQSLMALNRVSLTGRKMKQNKATVVITEANFKTNGKMIYVSITDVGNDSTSISSLAPWSAMQFQNIRNDGYEKSIILDGNKIDEQYNSGSHTANLSVIYNGRILVELIGTNCSLEELYTIIK